MNYRINIAEVELIDLNGADFRYHYVFLDTISVINEVGL